MKTKLLILIACLQINSILSQTTLIPDVNFEQRLINSGYDTGTPNGFVFTDSINTITYLNIESENISSLIGIEDFAALKTLWCSSNQLTELNLTQNSMLEWLICHSNSLTELDVSQNSSLIDLECSNNELSSLDVTQNTNLQALNCSSNQIGSLDLTQNPILESVKCSNNQLNDLDLSQNSSILIIDCFSNQLTELDVSQNSLLQYLSCASNELNELDLTQNLTLYNLLCNDNTLNYLNLSQNTVLLNLDCSSNQLGCLNIKNGNNSNMADFNAIDNPELTCIEVDDVSYSLSNWILVDSQVSFDTNCNFDCTVNVDDVENKLSRIRVHPNPNNGTFSILLGKTENRITLKLVNNLGQVITTNEYLNLEKIDLEINFPDGLYFVFLEGSSGGKSISKIIVE